MTNEKDSKFSIKELKSIEVTQEQKPEYEKMKEK